MHHEVELGIVIGMQGRAIKEADAMRHIAGYFIGLDFTNRDLQQFNASTGGDWPLAKGANSFAGVSDFVHKSELPDPANIEIELSVNGETRQSSSTSDLIFDIPTIIADISKYQELREGDLIFTGTPSGVAKVQNGDQLTCSLRNGEDSGRSILATLDIRIAQQ